MKLISNFLTDMQRHLSILEITIVCLLYLLCSFKVKSEACKVFTTTKVLVQRNIHLRAEILNFCRSFGMSHWGWEGG